MVFFNFMCFYVTSITKAFKTKIYKPPDPSQVIQWGKAKFRFNRPKRRIESEPTWAFFGWVHTQLLQKLQMSFAINVRLARLVMRFSQQHFPKTKSNLLLAATGHKRFPAATRLKRSFSCGVFANN